MILSTTSDIINIITSNSGNTQVLVSWADHTTTAFTPSRTNTIITAASTTTIVSSPSASTQRQIKTIVISNRDSSLTNSISVQFYDGTNTIVVFKRLLGVNESIEYDGTKWLAYDSNGYALMSTGISAAGSDKSIQFNDGGNLVGGSSDFTWDDSSNKLSLLGTNTGIKLSGITSEPGVQSTGILQIYAKSVCGKIMLKQVGPSGLDTPLQNAIWQNNTALFTVGAAAGVWQGTVGTNLGTPTVVLPTTTNLATMLRRSNFPTVVTTLNQQVGTRTEAMFFRGNAAGLGGFFFVARFMFTSWKAGNRLFVGMSVGTTGQVTVDPSTLLNQCGFGVNSGDTAITFMHNDGAGVSTKDTIAGQPALANNQGYVAYIFCKPNDSVVYYRLDDLNLGTTIIDSSTNTDLPVNTTALVAHCAIGNGPNIIAGDAAIGINRIYIETDI